MFFLLKAICIGLAVTAGLVVSARLPVGTSKVPISEWADLFTFTAEQVTGAMQAPVPPLPTAGSMGPDTIEALKTANRKLTSDEVKERSAVLQSFWKSSYPSIPLASFQEWAQPIYARYLTSLGLSGVAHFKEQGYHRAIILGMSTVSVIVESSDTLLLKLNHFSALDPSEMRFWTGLAKIEPNNSAVTTGSLRRRTTPNQARRILSALPANYDMRSTGLMPPIRNQLQCGACWAFTASSTMEIQNMFADGKREVGELSEQEMIACDTYDGGCNGGEPQTAWDWIKFHGGLTTAAIYPYAHYSSTDISSPACDRTLSAPLYSVLTASGSTEYLPTDSSTNAQILASEEAIMRSIHAGHPVTLLVSASSSCFYGYSSGVMACSCGGAVDHTVLAIGWTPTYFIIRNQWFVFVSASAFFLTRNFMCMQGYGLGYGRLCVFASRPGGFLCKCVFCSSYCMRLTFSCARNCAHRPVVNATTYMVLYTCPG